MLTSLPAPPSRLMVEIMETATGMRAYDMTNSASLAKMIALFEAMCRRQAEVLAADDPGGPEIDAEIALMQEWSLARCIG